LNAFNDKVSIGFGPTINRIGGEISGMVPNPLSPGRNDGKLKARVTTLPWVLTPVSWCRLQIDPVWATLTRPTCRARIPARTTG